MGIKKIIAAVITMVMVMTFIPTSAMAATTGWQGSDSSGWRYYTTSSQYVKNNWKQIGGKWYYFNSNGYMESNCYRDGYWLTKTGEWDSKSSHGTWKSNSNGWWYEDNGWYPKSRWLWIDGNCYYFNSKGFMESDCYRDGCYLTKSGAWDRRYSHGTWKHDSAGWWYEDNGWYPKNQWLWIDAKCYYFKSNGYMAVNEMIDGSWVGADGAWTSVVPNTKINSSNFPDSDFRKFISENFDTDKNGELSPAEIRKVTKIDIENPPSDDGYTFNISTFKGIEYFTELTVLIVKRCDYPGELDISKNMKLTYVEFYEVFKKTSSSKSKITMRVGQYFTIDEMTSSAMYTSSSKPYVEASNTSVLTVAFAKQKCLKTKVTAKSAGTSTITGRINGTVTVVN